MTQSQLKQYMATKSNVLTLSASLILYTYCRFDVSNTFHTNWDRGNKRLEKLWDAQTIPVQITTQVKRITVTGVVSRQCMKGASL